ncbi:MAG: hypothetical protein ABI687_04805 [Flavitalea sp.]
MKATRDNLFTDGARGSARNLTIRKRKSGQFVISARRGKSTKEPTPNAVANREKFKLGIIYGKAVLKDPEKKALYAAAAGPDMSAYTMAVRDAVTSPKVVSIDVSQYTGKPGEPIMVRALDDFSVASLKLAIHSAAGELLERGDAVRQDNENDWLYTTTTANEPIAGSKIAATAADLPNNTGSLEIVL